MATSNKNWILYNFRKSSGYNCSRLSTHNFNSIQIVNGLTTGKSYKETSKYIRGHLE